MTHGDVAQLCGSEWSRTTQLERTAGTRSNTSAKECEMFQLSEGPDQAV